MPESTPDGPFDAADVTIAIPTYERGAVLVDTLHLLVAQAQPGVEPEIVVVDQSTTLAPEVERALAELDAYGVRHVRLPRPSIPGAMNTALRLAHRPLVLFLDDDIVPGPDLAAAHAAAYTDDAVWGVAGQVLQPGEEPLSGHGRRGAEDDPPVGRRLELRRDLDFVFRSSQPAWVASVMAGNLSVRRARALAVGGFDENFSAVAYRFETEFCRRLLRSGGRVRFEPRASLRHLRAAQGGTRRHGDHLTWAAAAHARGDYYFAFVEGRGRERLRYLARRPWRALAARFYLRRPWWLPVRLAGEAAGVWSAWKAWRQGPRLLDPAERSPATAGRQRGSAAPAACVSRPWRLGIAATHPVQYQVPWFQALARRADVDLTVFYALLPTPEQQGVGFGRPFRWDLPLLDGYRYQVLENVSRRPSPSTFLGCDTPRVADPLRAAELDALVVLGWVTRSCLQALNAARRLGVPCLVRGDSNALKPRPWLWRLWQRRLLRRFSACLVVGRANHAFYRQAGVPEERLFFAPHAVDNARFAAQAETLRPERPALRAAWGIAAESFVFAFAGKLLPKKRPLDLVEAFVRAHGLARAAGRRLHLLWVGEGPLREACRARLESAGVSCLPGPYASAAATFAGFLNQGEIARAYCAADALVLPSDHGETWGLVVNEAMACGLPAVVSDQVGCQADLVEPGVTGSVFPCGDVDALAACLGALAADPPLARRLGDQARTRLARYSIDSLVEGTLAGLRYSATPGRAAERAAG